MYISVSEPVFKCVAECCPVKGSRRSIIYDLPRNTYDFIPNTLYDILTNCDGSTLEEVKNVYEDRAIISDYFDFLLGKEYIFLCKQDDLMSFPPLELTWEHPSLINSAVVSLNSETNYDLTTAFRSLDRLGCRHIFIRVEEVQDFDYYQTLLRHFSKSTYLSVEIEAPYIASFSISTLKDLLKEHPRLRAFICRGAPDTLFIPSPHLGFGMIAWITEHAGHNDQILNFREYFNVNIPLYTEAQYHNVYFNRKVFIDSEGFICNSPVAGNRFGHLSKDTLIDVLDRPGFKRYWNISKDKIEICRDCEFRYMCMDNRSPVQDAAGNWSHSSECEYNPYLALWKGEAGYAPVENQVTRKKRKIEGQP
jgi:SPASM domain peptide maturase of grasp-with-spasm system